MHLSSIINILGILQLFLAAAMLLPLPFTLFYGEDWRPIVYSSGITAAIGFAMFKLAKFNQDLRPKEGFAVVSLSWVALSVFGSLPYMISGAIPSFTNAFFETMSGLTTTGATILIDIEAMPKGLLMWRSLTQWIGGMGIIVLTLAILPFLGVGGMQLFKAEVPGPSADKLTPRVTQTAKVLWAVYVLLTALQTICLMLAGMNFFEALCHSFTTLASGGYSTRNGSIADFNSPAIENIIIVFMFLAGTSFALHYRLLKGDFKAHFRSQEFVFYVAIIGLSSFFVCGHILASMPDMAFSKALRDTVFQVISIQTSTGFGTADYELWSGHAQIILFFLMFVGGCAGSTAGGMKTVRVLLLIKFAFSEFVRLLHPQAVVNVRLGEQTVPRQVLMNLFGFFILYMGLFGIGVFVMTGLGMNAADPKEEFISAFGAVASCIGNIGPGFGCVGPTDNFAHIGGIGKWFLCFLMLLGRLEIYTVLILLAPSFWKK